MSSGSFARGRCRRGRSDIPHFCSKLLLFALVGRLVLWEKQRKFLKRRKRGKMHKKREKCAKKGGKCVKKRESHSDPIYTNPIKNLPIRGLSGSGLRSVHKVSRECPRSVRDTFLTLRGHSRNSFWTPRSAGPKGPAWDTLSDTPRLQRHSQGHFGPEGPERLL